MLPSTISFCCFRFLSKSNSLRTVILECSDLWYWNTGILILVCQSLVCVTWSYGLDTYSRCFISVRLNTVIFCIQLGNVGYLLCFWHNVLFPGKARHFRSHLFITYYLLSMRKNTHWFFPPYSRSKVIIVLLKVDVKWNCDNRERQNCCIMNPVAENIREFHWKPVGGGSEKELGEKSISFLALRNELK